MRIKASLLLLVALAAGPAHAMQNQRWAQRRHAYLLRVAPTPQPELTLMGEVVAVLDGDTIIVLDTVKTEHRIRLMGMDAPEKSQAFGQVSKQHLSDLVYRKPVEIHYRHADKYGRLIGKVMVYGVDANLEQVKRGLAWHYAHFAKEQDPSDASAYAQAEAAARAAHLGLWQDARPQAPWDYRHHDGE